MLGYGNGKVFVLFFYANVSKLLPAVYYIWWKIKISLLTNLPACWLLINLNLDLKNAYMIRRSQKKNTNFVQSKMQLHSL